MSNDLHDSHAVGDDPCQEIGRGDIIEATIASSHPRTVRVQVDRTPWLLSDRTTALPTGAGPIAVLTSTMRVVERGAELVSPADRIKFLDDSPEEAEKARKARRDQLADLADPGCERCEGTGLDPDTFTTSDGADGTVYHLTEPCRDCIDEDLAEAIEIDEALTALTGTKRVPADAIVLERPTDEAASDLMDYLQVADAVSVNIDDHVVVAGQDETGDPFELVLNQVQARTLAAHIATAADEAEQAHDTTTETHR